jgi:hypothetical protein
MSHDTLDILIKVSADTAGAEQAVSALEAVKQAGIAADDQTGTPTATAANKPRPVARPLAGVNDEFPTLLAADQPEAGAPSDAKAGRTAGRPAKHLEPVARLSSANNGDSSLPPAADQPSPKTVQGARPLGQAEADRREAEAPTSRPSDKPSEMPIVSIPTSGVEAAKAAITLPERQAQLLEQTSQQLDRIAAASKAQGDALQQAVQRLERAANNIGSFTTAVGRVADAMEAAFSGVSIHERRLDSLEREVRQFEERLRHSFCP